MKILLATDGSECSELAVEEVARKKWPPGSSVRVVSVIELNAVVAAVPEACTPAQEFCDEAWGADLIVVGSHGRGFTGRLLHGSTSHEIATRANCEVRVVTRRD
ncbi:MAG: universal stress protein [Acidobacteria bacterium]|nr:universal stress protein [Acidobacteriota bacterium]